MMRIGSVILVLALAACSGAVNTQAPSTPASPPAGLVTSTSVAASSGAESSSPADDFFTALTNTLAAGSYRFDGTVRLTPASGPVEVTLSGWVDGNDRTLEVSVGGETIRTTVIGGVATVETPSGSRQVPLAEAARAPSLEVLRQIRIETAEQGRITGMLPAGAGKMGGIDQIEPVPAEVTVTYSTTIDAYRLRDLGGRWVIDMTFSQIGESFTG